MKKRIETIDLLRGLIMVIMALDHVRDFFHVTAQTADPLDPATTTPALFFTRWITHFCAPTFLFLSGVSAFLSAQGKPRENVSVFLMKRGAWLVAVDLVVMSFALTFDPGYAVVFLTVLWAIGCSMILLGLVLRLSLRLVVPLGLVLFFGHDLFFSLHLPPGTALSAVLEILFSGRFFLPVGHGHLIGFLYPILPWTGVLFLGYGFGQYAANRAVLLRTGLALVALFLFLRFVNRYGDPLPWKPYPGTVQTVLSFLNAAKYPPSLQFLCMTLGPVLVFLSLVRWTNAAWQRVLAVYGRVPFFYFVVHFFLAHLFVVAAFFATGHTAAQIRDGKSPFLFRPADFGFALPVVYVVWLLVVLLLYPPCRWFYRYKTTHPQWWLRYL